MKDFVAEIVAERTDENPEFPALVAEAEAQRAAYCYALYEDGPYYGDFDSREEALEAGLVWARLEEEYASVYTAKSGAPTLASRYMSENFAEWVLENLLDEAGDAAAESTSPEWLENVTPAQRHELHAAFAAALDTWCAVHGHTPKFWHVEEVREHAVPLHDEKED